MTLVNIILKNDKNKILKDFDWIIQYDEDADHDIDNPLPLGGFEQLLNILIDMRALNPITLAYILLSEAKHGKIEICRKMIDNGANVNSTGLDSWTPLHFDSQEGHLNIVQLN